MKSEQDIRDLRDAIKLLIESSGRLGRPAAKLFAQILTFILQDGDTKEQADYDAIIEDTVRMAKEYRELLALKTAKKAAESS